MRFGEFFRKAVLPIVPWAALFAGVLAATAQLVQPGNLLAVAACCVPATVVYVAGVARFGVSEDERAALVGFLLPARRPS